MLEELQLNTSEACALRSDQLLNFDYRRLERQLGAFLGPRPSREDLGRLTFLFTNVMTQLAGAPRQCSRLVYTMPQRPLATLWRNAHPHPL